MWGGPICRSAHLWLTQLRRFVAHAQAASPFIPMSWMQISELLACAVECPKANLLQHPHLGHTGLGGGNIDLVPSEVAKQRRSGLTQTGIPRQSLGAGLINERAVQRMSNRETAPPRNNFFLWEWIRSRPNLSAKAEWLLKDPATTPLIMLKHRLDDPIIHPPSQSSKSDFFLSSFSEHCYTITLFAPCRQG